MAEQDTAKATADETVTVSPAADLPAGASTEPAWEEGPHLNDPEIRAAKRQQLIDAGIDHDDERLTDDMRAILKER